MRKLFFISIILTSFTSCNDGDIIITDFNFEASNLNNCGGPGAYIFYNVNNSSAAESISLILETTAAISNDNAGSSSSITSGIASGSGGGIFDMLMYFLLLGLSKRFIIFRGRKI